MVLKYVSDDIQIFVLSISLNLIMLIGSHSKGLVDIAIIQVI